MNEKHLSRIAFLLLSVFGFLTFSQAVHLTIHAHRICAQHGEWVDHDEELVDSNVEKSIAEANAPGHSHCPVVSTEAEKRWKLPAEQAIQIFALHSVPPTILSSRIIYLTPPLENAPKTSPPA